MDISPSELSPTSSPGPSAEVEPEVGRDAELEAYLAAERTANDYHPGGVE